MVADLAILRAHARSIWDTAVAAVEPFTLVRQALEVGGALHTAAARAARVLVVGGGKAGAAMAAGVEAALPGARLEGIVNVPAGTQRPTRVIRLHQARPAGTNHPTMDGVVGSRQMLALLAGAGPDDLALCLLSGGGSALLPAPAPGLSLEDNLAMTRLLHASGATIDEMNCVRKHLSQLKGGRMAQAFHGGSLFSLILSDVVGDPLDVIASGPTAADPTTFADALNVLQRYGLREQAPTAVWKLLEEGATGAVPETLKSLPDTVHNIVIGNNARALAAARERAQQLGYHVLDLGAFVEGETQQVATVLAGVVRSIRSNGQPVRPPACILSGGETTVTLTPGHGKGGRNQEFVLALAGRLGPTGLNGVVALSAGTDGEDGPTDAAGAMADTQTLQRAAQWGLSVDDHLARHDAYPFFDATGDLLKTGLTGTNVMDVRVVLMV
jgi:glycerate 2-kinase